MRAWRTAGWWCCRGTAQAASSISALQGSLELLVGLVGAREVGVADEEALAVVVGVDEPAGDVVGRGVADLARSSGRRRPRP